MIKKKTDIADEFIRNLVICEKDIQWHEVYNDLPKAWADCKNTYWMMRFAERIGIDRRLSLLIGCDLLELLECYKTDVDINKMINAIRLWYKNESDISEVRKYANPVLVTATSVCSIPFEDDISASENYHVTYSSAQLK